METVRTENAGGVVVNARGEVAVVSQRGVSWSLPKGHLEAGETPLEAARREIAEEAGIADLSLVRELGSYERFGGGKKGVMGKMRELKNLTFFLFTTGHGELVPVHPDHPEVRWVPIAQVADLLTHSEDKAFFRGVVATSGGEGNIV